MRAADADGSKEGVEPAHIHVQHQNDVAKFWLRQMRLASSYGFKAKELARLHLIVAEHRILFLEAWNEYFGA